MPRKFKQAYFVSFIAETDYDKPYWQPVFQWGFPYWHCHNEEPHNEITFPSGPHKRFLVPSSRIPLCQINFPYTNDYSPDLSRERLTNKEFAKQKMKTFFQNMPSYSIVYISIHSDEAGCVKQVYYEGLFGSSQHEIIIPPEAMAQLLNETIPHPGKLGLKIHLLACCAAVYVQPLMQELDRLGFTKTCVVGYPSVVSCKTDEMSMVDFGGESPHHKLVHRSTDPAYRKTVCHNYGGQVVTDYYKTFKWMFLLPELAEQENCDSFFSLLIDILSHDVRDFFVQDRISDPKMTCFLDKLQEIDHEVSTQKYSTESLNKAIYDFIVVLKVLFRDNSQIPLCRLVAKTLFYFYTAPIRRPPEQGPEQPGQKLQLFLEYIFWGRPWLNETYLDAEQHPDLMRDRIMQCPLPTAPKSQQQCSIC